MLTLRRPIIVTHHTGGNFTPKWEGPYVVYQVYANGAYEVVDGEGFQLGPINDKFLNHYFRYKTNA